MTRGDLADRKLATIGSPLQPERESWARSSQDNRRRLTDMLRAPRTVYPWRGIYQRHDNRDFAYIRFWRWVAPETRFWRTFYEYGCFEVKPGREEYGRMKRSRFSEEQIIGILKEQEAGLNVADLLRKHGISDSTF